ncbi:hypothetical protein PPTG_22792 [Phytophthora nicotianae INRA-310]|uniref:Myosin motor domain-containing protein n=1 Tax=Phytophthora nicotianae (strain INRA-310) TaxID=761204 RepID=W2QB50_PHYN3|nr:hypothetical protein PPTG_22792 [Phytophthora nicotianae INRA-310]ETN10096.1 hypothetical protein PPTG_22792 [Phytophthora nicotianae INRA-310]
MTLSGAGAAAAHAAGTRQPKALASGSVCSSDIKAEAVSAVQLRVGDLYWKQDGPYGWTLGQVTAFDHNQQNATYVLIDEATGEHLSRSEDDELPADLQIEQLVDLRQTPLFAANPLFSTAADMTSLRHLHEAALAKNLEDRAALQNQRPYTFMANVLIAVNPLRQLPEPDKMLFVGQPLDRCPPHPYNVAENAYRQLCAVRAVMQNQSIIISGESGSGKTETSKIILDFLTMRAVHNPALSTASCTSTSDDEMEPEITANNRPVLGCMGPPGSSTLACDVEIDAFGKSLHLKPKTPEAYSYLNQSGCMRSDLIDDAENFCNLKSALQFIGIRDSAQHEIFRLVAGLLHMGNIHISQEDTEEGETACIRQDDVESQEAVRHASELLGVSVEQLTESILLKRIMTRGSRRNSIYFIKRDVRNAVYSRDTIAKTIYENTWVGPTLAILWAYDFPTNAYRLGDTRLFFRTGKIDLLDKLLTPAPSTTENLGQQLLLYLRKKHWISVTTAIITFNAFKRIFQDVRYRRRATVIQCMVRQHLARKRVRKLRVQLRMHKLWTRMSHQAQIMHAYQDRPEDKMVLLDKLLAKNYLPVKQRWLLKWLGPLQRVIYLQKRWKKITAQYMAKRGFLWLFETVRRKRSALRVQSHVRAMIARTRFLELKKKALARHRWHAAYLKVKVFGLFNRQLRLIHVDRLEKDNSTLMNSMAAVTEKLGEAQEEAKTAKLQLKQLQVSFDEVKIEAKQQQQRVEELELALQARRFEVAELRRQTGGSLVERIIRFFTCSAAISPPSSPRGMVTPSRLPSLKRQTQSASEETSDKGERIVWATPLSEAVMIPQDEDSNTTKRRLSVTAVSEEPAFDAEEEEFRSKDADMLWSVSRYMF